MIVYESFLSIVFYVALGIVLLVSTLVVRRSMSASANALAAREWFKSMDVASQGQRYQGSRSQIIADFGSGKRGPGTYELFVGCQTLSGREFFLRVVSSMGIVGEWELVPVERGEISATLVEANAVETEKNESQMKS
jgi:hypothetical protein